MKVLVVKDIDENVLTPQAGIWKDNEAGKMNAEFYTEKNKKDMSFKIVLAELEEIIK